MKLSVIIPFVGEFPQVMFTIQAVANNILCDPSIDFEILAVDNYCQEAKLQALHSATIALEKIIGSYRSSSDDEDWVDKMIPLNKGGREDPIDMWKVREMIKPTYENRSGEAVKACARGWPWLRYISVDTGLSHWEAKRIACEQATGDIFLFLDSHIIPTAWAIPRMFNAYVRRVVDNRISSNSTPLRELGSLHLPVTYKILEWHWLIYKLVVQNNHFYSYSFTPFRASEVPYEVPCMSTCGMMISREIYERIGGWPAGMTMYGGGENFMNYTLAVCGYKKWIFPGGCCHHHADSRDYHYTGDGLIWNRMVAHYLFGGRKGLMNFKSVSKGNPDTLEEWMMDIISRYYDHRSKIKDIQKIEITDWAKEWIDEK
jgi:hypothetical protein